MVRVKYRIWTVVSCSNETLISSVHESEEHAYRSLVERFMTIECGPGGTDVELAMLLAQAGDIGDYEGVRRYIQKNASKIEMLQIAEHPLNLRQAIEVQFTGPRVEQELAASV